MFLFDRSTTRECCFLIRFSPSFLCFNLEDVQNEGGLLLRLTSPCAEQNKQTWHHTNGPGKPPDWHSGFAWPAPKVPWSPRRCCLPVCTAGKGVINTSARNYVKENKVYIIYGVFASCLCVLYQLSVAQCWCLRSERNKESSINWDSCWIRQSNFHAWEQDSSVY